MRSALFFLIVLAAGTAFAMWLAGLGGTVQIQVGEAYIATSFPLAVLIAALGFLALHLLLSLVTTLRRLPRRLRAGAANRNRREGDAAVTRALVALAAGTGDAARLEVRKARNYLGDTPQTLLLAAEAERLSGNEDAAAASFRLLAAREDARFLGLRGLLRQAMAKGDWDAARALAREAEAAQPGAAWLREERRTLALETRDWREAVALASPEQPRAQLALAAAEQEPDPARAAEYERQAFLYDRGFAPAALAFAARLKARGDLRKSKAVLEDAWAAGPHPDLLEPYLADAPDALMRLRATETLIKRNPAAPESRLALARATLAARFPDRARKALDALIGSGEADRRAYLLLAEVEEAEQGAAGTAPAGQARLLAEAQAAKPEPRWHCGHCGTAHGTWAPVCGACNTPGQIAWTAAPPAAMPASAAA
ncbi:heme biosynthesis HemY N-terminal domain-containing protein [Paracraurococcus ruber]|uniref:Heme biosynthesis protein HemY n=1 Tax=Paracraurococcus ruber TaxID=77675 RepID=A0ABS1D4W0_9PROT|nr:heme biosynthesis HemY N-terminal domain-containing protein [Paracraurococcus ruber]MBK1661112.1 heme biosynthesis protein HemY [Paracraurococcus ruber]TDG27410.1 heme biosynthesis protein HemY [Paracraurococcus ruber]